MPDLDHIFNVLQDQNKTLAAQGALLASISRGQEDTRERLFGANGQPGALYFLSQEIGKTNVVVGKHTDQISFWRGALAIVTVLLTTAMAWAGVVLGKHVK